MSARRVVVTGMGLVCPLGTKLHTAWASLLSGTSAVSRLSPSTERDEELFAQVPCNIAACVPEVADDILDDGNAFDWQQFSTSERRQMSRGMAFAISAGNQALADAGISQRTSGISAVDGGLAVDRNKTTDLLIDIDSASGSASTLSDVHLDRTRVGVAIGMGVADLMDIYETGRLLADSKYRKVSPYFVPRILTNMAAGWLSIKHGLKGPNHSVSTACTTGAHSIGDAFTLIKSGKADAMLCGGTDACVTPIGMAGFCRMRALSTSFDETPERASRPFDKQRDGFVMGEGAGVLFLEAFDVAMERGAPQIYAEVLGYGMSGDGYHLTSPDECGGGAELCIRRALDDAGIAPSAVAYVNAHATSTPQGDRVESRALATVFGGDCLTPVVSSTKGALGHLLGAAGAVETICTILSLREGVVAPNVNLQQTDIEYGLHYAPASRAIELDPVDNDRTIAVKNSFGFGGTNASLCLADYKDE